jgi:Cys-rich protein (TIGR01571 family)
MDQSWGHWRNGIYNYCEPHDVCLLAYLFPFTKCILQGQTVSMVTGKHLIYPCLLPVFLCHIGSAINRGTIRNAYGIKGSFLDDLITHFCDSVPALTQERREVVLMGQRGYLNFMKPLITEESLI